jgi:hypothetical protein
MMLRLIAPTEPQLAGVVCVALIAGLAGVLLWMLRRQRRAAA